MDIVFVLNRGMLEVEPELYSKEKDAGRRVEELCKEYDVPFSKRHTSNIDVFWFANVDPDEKLQGEKHECLDYFKDTGKTDFADDSFLYLGICTKCGRKMTQKYRYVETFDTDTGEEIK